ncbi:branched-chain amino acid ABC transporter permease [Allorhizobium taibaishanense]|uniref:Branched-chain amino acid ABC transporter permease n=2 Tax=Allorhizobium taibaishanense TaxID=887144 RepID=A0A1Q9A7M4_9HYPH|nr:ABC transporter permease [Allorhizobium taibaishanense]OLP50546.1 branched-chain amino acid ABC transporter permease [Allorhizobium taibaishanense]
MSYRAISGSLMALGARSALLAALVIVFSTFALTAPSFLTTGNLQSLLVNNFTLLAVVAVAMTFAVASGGIDLSVGAAIDFASFAFVSLVLAGNPVWLALFAGLGAGALVGLFNALLISGVGLSPFLATLGTLFVGRSIQQLLTNGGNPIYLSQSGIPESFRALGHGTIVGIPLSLLAALALAAVAAFLLGQTRFGRVVIASGVQPDVVRYSGLPLRLYLGGAYILVGLTAAFAGLILTSTITVYIPNSGNAFLLNAIGAAFIGTTIHPHGRPNVLGTILGVLLLAIVSNGLLLSGLNFYWQQVGTGLLIFLVLALSFATRKTQRG